MKRSVMFALVLVAVLAAECRSASYSFKQLDLQGGSAGFGINNSGQVVGVSAPMGPPVLYSGGMKHTLVTEGSGLDINENGQIVGWGFFSSGTLPFLVSMNSGRSLAIFLVVFLEFDHFCSVAALYMTWKK